MLTGNRVVEPAGKILGGSGTQNFDFAHIWPLVPPGDPNKLFSQLYFIAYMPFFKMRVLTQNSVIMWWCQREVLQVLKFCKIVHFDSFMPPRDRRILSQPRIL